MYNVQIYIYIYKGRHRCLIQTDSLLLLLFLRRDFCGRSQVWRSADGSYECRGDIFFFVPRRHKKLIKTLVFDAINSDSETPSSLDGVQALFETLWSAVIIVPFYSGRRRRILFSQIGNLKIKLDYERALVDIARNRCRTVACRLIRTPAYSIIIVG